MVSFLKFFCVCIDFSFCKARGLREALQNENLIRKQYSTSSDVLYSLEELQLFAGKEDKQEARRVYHSALEWITSPDSRRAVWHAGQTIRAARKMAPGSLTGFLAIGVYYAGLALWSYAVVSKANNTRLTGSPASSIASQGPTVFLDAEEMPEVTKFFTLSCGIPAIQGPNGPITLADTSTSMQTVQRVLRPDPSERTPPLVQSLAQLIGDLGHCVPMGGV